MNPAQSRALGQLLRQKRLELGYSTYHVAKAAGIADSTVIRLENGDFKAPRPEKLARFAELLDLPIADLYAKAGYVVPEELPSFTSYLETKYASLSASAITELTVHFEALMANQQ